MSKPPASYRNIKRPPLMEAIRLEGGTIEEGAEALERKGYFEPPPRPWKLGSSDRGIGRKNFAVLDRFGDVVVLVNDRRTAELIISAVNAHSFHPKKNGKERVKAKK